MGIPSYFMHIVRKYPQVIKSFALLSSISSFAVDHLYLDCNSVIYAAYHELAANGALPSSASDEIIRLVCVKLDEYIALVAPRRSVLIAFDGVAPVAKLEQQRQRRFKAIYQQRILEQIRSSGTPSKPSTAAAAADIWSTTSITPGTKFMRDLGAAVTAHYANLNHVIVSCSAEHGEGEHKIFEHIRSNPADHADACTVVYGLDADLIMLAMNHLRVCPHIYLFRETPEFIQSIDPSLEPNGNYLVDIPLFAEKIQETRGISPADYIFTCFFLGNDFMPHFPAVNIRTGGHDKLMKAYEMLEFGTSPERCFIYDSGYVEIDEHHRKKGQCEVESSDGGGEIQWSVVMEFVRNLALHEERFIIQEHKHRDSIGKRLCARFDPASIGKRDITHSGSDRETFEWERFEQAPQFERAIEQRINPFRPNWRNRYYSELFARESVGHSHSPLELRDRVCSAYLEGLSWTFDYYTRSCPDYRWKYPFAYPPLFGDLLKYMERMRGDIKLTLNPPSSFAGFPVPPLVQLCYVLPQSQLHLLPRALERKLRIYYEDWYCGDAAFMGAYCRYFWESHVHLPDIPLKQLESVVMNEIVTENDAPLSIMPQLPNNRRLG